MFEIDIRKMFKRSQSVNYDVNVYSNFNFIGISLSEKEIGRWHYVDKYRRKDFYVE